MSGSLKVEFACHHGKFKAAQNLHKYNKNMKSLAIGAYQRTRFL